MQYGGVFPAVEAAVLGDLAVEAETAGWDGVFVWDLVWGVDPWISLAVVALRTSRVRFGTMLTPLSRRRPWKVASEVATLDRLSGGRAILPVGLGAVAEDDSEHDWFRQVGEVKDRRTRAQLLDESLDILDGLWRGGPFSYSGKHYTLREVEFSPLPVQRPRVPIWVVGAWGRERSMRRVLRYDGVMPLRMPPGEPFREMTPEDVREMAGYIAGGRASGTPGMPGTPFDIVIEGETPGDDPQHAAAHVRPFAEAGATWWLESVWAGPETRGGVEGMRERLRQGPPRV